MAGVYFEQYTVRHRLKGMSNNTCIILKDNLELYDSLFSQMADTSAFNVKVLAFERLLESRTLESLEKSQLLNIYIAVENDFYEERREELVAYARAALERPFTNFIHFYTTPAFLSDPKFLEGGKHCFYLSPSEEPGNAAIHFTSFLSSLFEKSIISNRLMDYIHDSFRDVVYSEILIKKNKEIERLNEELERRNKIDYLTNLYNRNALFEFLNCEWKRTSRDLWRINNSELGERRRDMRRSERRHNPIGSILDHFGVFSIMMIDLDHFKAINDTYGHLAGDKVLKTAGKLFMSDNILRKNDISCRYGGEEFIVILPETSSEHALGPALRLSETFSNISFFENHRNFNVTLSVGISESHPEDTSSEDIIHRADKALYHAKKQGKGAVVVYEHVFQQDSEG
jgi:diguanylate cyclase (GGDEF)-like protein